MSKSQPPLFDLFILMRDSAGLPLTIDQYHMLLQALRGGFGVSSRDELKQVCRLLWVKSKSSPQVERFEKCFEQYFEESSEDLEPEEKQEPRDTKTEGEQKSTSTSTQKTSKTPEKPTAKPKKPDSPNYSQVPTAIRGRLLPEKPFDENKRYRLIPQDFPATPRQIEQNWRYLRRPIREGALTEIDIEATVKRIIEDGVFLKPVLIPNRVNRLEMLLLIDVSNSMIPFRLFYERIVATLQGSRLGKTDIYYFRNCPRDYLYLHPRRPDAQEIKEILPKLHRNRTVVVIISDGGAARGGMNEKRIKLTEEFLEQLTPYVRHIAWLNPMPWERWEDKYNSAKEISQFSQLVQMFELDYRGLKDAVRFLKK
ncbi:conserved hypothetical protein [Hyella patelloides LEGE 07179]|uniref:VWA containing CoxE family protein n=1 Tax=Hyella patelloides LEGE 07179 TaxID=945734 RepID=A0A563VWZ9_9CYAN|nr:hypothetical protein [Hyella patelloides]VEP15982.1 conserved hypothetical protein [Hyella patelloides LEGE 07179]